TLHPVLTDCGLTHGAKRLFHHPPPLAFSMANMLPPGYFDLATMDTLRTHGLSFFFELHPDRDNMRTYDAMLATVHRIRTALGGEFRDEKRNAFTVQTAEHGRARIREFARRQLTRHE
ncbi:MAG: cell division protein ZipA, partial [Cellvibrionales bacterium]|nr:cell division protein ZipA [Cellvibrionales bacterium]